MPTLKDRACLALCDVAFRGSISLYRPTPKCFHFPVVFQDLRKYYVSLLKGLPSYLSWIWFSQWKTTCHSLWIAKCQLVGAAFQCGRCWDGHGANYHGYNYKRTWRHGCLTKPWRMERPVFLYGLQFSYCQLLKGQAALHVCLSLISL